MEGYHRGRRDDFEATRYANHEMAALVGIAFHQPSEMPQYKPLGGAEAEPLPDNERVSSEADIQRVRGFFMTLAAQSQSHNQE